MNSGVLKITAHYPVLLVEDVSATAGFYETHFGFARQFDAGWYVHLAREEDGKTHQMAVMRCDHDTIPEAGRTPTRGLIVNVEVSDVDEVHARMEAAGVPMQQSLRSEKFGQRHFMTADPGGVLVDVITPIPFDPDWLAEQGL
ncbi:VOC family protein [Devosia nitrariae]|uniref:Glyoxalase n=1 Tax=Devosia nitrariae TaxID=2071872 RepID=A0ABQ5W013_9HYPH|nr:VOC family protein [Devosia nitrariae]GLQ53405.1 glyoxalase [Devosia nitrariae]